MAASIGLTLLAYALARVAADRVRSPFLNTFLIGSLLLIGALLALDLPYVQFRQAARPLSFLLGPATVALGVPLYKHLRTLRGQLWRILIGSAAGALAGVVSVALAARLGRLEPAVALSLLPKSVTTPIAVAIGQTIGARAELVAAFTALTGFTGAVYAAPFLSILGVRASMDRGLAFGAALHGVGVSVALGEDELAGALAGVGMCLTGVFTALAAPLLAPWLGG